MDGEFTLSIKNSSNVLVESVTIEDSTYAGGKFGFYAAQRQNVTFANFTSRKLGTRAVRLRLSGA